MGSIPLFSVNFCWFESLFSLIFYKFLLQQYLPTATRRCIFQFFNNYTAYFFIIRLIRSNFKEFYALKMGKTAPYYWWGKPFAKKGCYIEPNILAYIKVIKWQVQQNFIFAECCAFSISMSLYTDDRTYIQFFQLGNISEENIIQNLQWKYNNKLPLLA